MTDVKTRFAEEFLLILLVYNFKILYRKKSENVRTDILNRRTDYFQNKKKILHVILKYIQKKNMKYNIQVFTVIFTIKNIIRV